MKYIFPLVFGALVLAQPAPEDEPCQSIVYETQYVDFTYCPCDSTMSEMPPMSSSSTSPSGDNGGNVGPTLTGGEGSSSSMSMPPPDSTVGPPPDTTSPPVGPPASSTSGGGDVNPPPNTAASSEISIAPPPLNTDSTSPAAPPPPGNTATTTTPAAPPPPPSTVGPAGTTQTLALADQGDYITRALFAHNLHRANASIPALVWNTTQALFAQQLAQTCVYGHSRAQGDGNYGQNIGAGFAPEEIPKMITNSMYNAEIGFYPGPYGANTVNTDNFAQWGHYSQIVWTNTVSVGCYTQDCTQQGGLQNTGDPRVRPLFTVCNYYPSGNFLNQFSQVARPGGGASVVFV